MFSGQNDVSVKNVYFSLTAIMVLVMIRGIMVRTVTMTGTNGNDCKDSRHKSSLARIKNSITSGIKNVIASFLYPPKKGRFAAFFTFPENDLYLQIVLLYQDFHQIQSH